MCSSCGQYSWTRLGSPVSLNQRSVFTVTSIAPQCCRILFLMDGLHLPHWKVEALASYTSKANACLYDSVYRMYLRRTGVPDNILVHNGINGRITETHLLNAEQWGTWGTFCAWLPGFKKAMGMGCADFYTQGTWQMTYAGACATYQKFPGDVFGVTA